MDVPTFVEGFHNLEKAKLLKYSQLGNTDMVVSHIGIGGCSAGGEYGPVNDQDSIDTIVEAVMSGINFVDTSPAYGSGKGEEVIGKALSKLPRKSYYISTKVGRYKPTWCEKFDFSAERTIESVELSLKRLGVDCIDLIQVQDLEFDIDLEKVVRETLPTLQRLVKQGKARYIGINGYPLSTLKQVLELSTVHVDTVLSYCRNTLMDQDLSSFIPYFQSRGLGIIDASLTGMSLLTSRGPPYWHPASQEIQAKAREAAQLCQDRNHELACLAVQFSVASPGVALHILGCDNVNILRQNFSAATIPPTEEELALRGEVLQLFSSVQMNHWENVEIGEYLLALTNTTPSRTPPPEATNGDEDRLAESAPQ